MKLVTIVGARPQFIKAAAVSKAIKSFNAKLPLLYKGKELEKIREVIVHTGQHYDKNMSKVFFEDLKLPMPDYNLDVGSDTQAKQTAKMLERIEDVLLLERPDMVLVYGDTNSTIAGAIVAAKLSIPIAHVEAGMRSYNRDMPEEINRIVADHLSNILFCSSKDACSILKSEGITKNVYLAGDVMFDSLNNNLSIAQKKSKVLSVLNIQPKGYYLATIHRAVNTNNLKRLKNILNILDSLDLPVLIPLHPRTRNVLGIHKKDYFNKNLRIIEALSYLDMLILEENSKIILTDSGGVQKEAFFLSVPCITLREETEWMETVNSGWNIFVGIDKQKIIKATQHFKAKLSYTKKKYYYGRGKASEKIVRILFRKFYEKSSK